MDAARLEAVLGPSMWALILRNHSTFGEKATDDQFEYARAIYCGPDSKTEIILWHPHTMMASKGAVFQFNAREKHGLLDFIADFFRLPGKIHLEGYDGRRIKG